MTKFDTLGFLSSTILQKMFQEQNGGHKMANEFGQYLVYWSF